MVCVVKLELEQAPTPTIEFHFAGGIRQLNGIHGQPCGMPCGQLEWAAALLRGPDPGPNHYLASYSSILCGMRVRRPI